MSIEFIGIAGTRDSDQTETGGRADGPIVVPAYLRELAVAHEQSGFDRILVAHSSATPDGFIVADQVLSQTGHLWPADHRRNEAGCPSRLSAWSGPRKSRSRAASSGGR